MSDRMAAQIWIGGKLPRRLLSELPIDDYRLDWDESLLQDRSEKGILAARDKDGLLHFADCEIAWGMFEPLETWLQEYEIPFRRHSDGRYDYDPCLVEFRPDLRDKNRRYLETITAKNGNPVVEVVTIEKVTKQMARLVKDQQQPAAERLRLWERLYRKLIRLLPPQLPPLPPLEIVD